MKKSWFFLLFTTFSLTACDPSPAPTPAAAQAQQHTQATVTAVAPWEIGNLEPNQSGVIFLRMNLIETLLESDAQGQLIPSLATEWHSDESGKIWTFTLRENVQFHNARTLDLQAVIHSLNIAKSKPGVLANGLIKDIRANNGKLEIELHKPFVPFPAFLTHYSTAILAPESYDQNGKVIALIGTGAFKPIHIQAPQKLSAQQFEHYWGEKPHLAQVNYLASSRSETRALMAQSDESALIFNLDTASIARLKKDPQLHITSESIARTIQLKMDTAKPFFNDVVIRNALSQTINRQAIAEQILRIPHGAADQILPPAFRDWRIKTEENTLDTAQVRQKLIEAGYQFDHQGKLSRAGTPFRFTLKTFADRPELPIIATILQAQWKQIGIDVDVSVGNFSEIPAGHQDGSLEMALYAFNYGKTLDPFGVIAQDFANGGSDWGTMNWHNTAVNHAISQLEKERDPVKAKALKQTISQAIYTEKPIIPIVYYQQNVVTHHGIKNITLDPFERRFFLEKIHR